MKPTAPGTLESLLAALPKAELHLHLEGALPTKTLLTLVHKYGLTALPQTPQDVASWYEFRDFAHFIRVYDEAVSVLRDEQDFELLTVEVGQALAAENVRYAEVFVTPYVHMRRGVSAETVLGGIESGRAQVEERYGVQMRWLLDFPGHRGPQAGEETLDVVLPHGLTSVIGFGVGGREVDRRSFRTVFERALSHGLRSVPHAGEAAGPEQIRVAVEELHADRVGHGVTVMSDPATVELLLRRDVALDVCPTSNLRTKVVRREAEHPLKAMVRAGLAVTLNSDDPSMFGTTLLNEYRLASRMGLDAMDLTALARRSFAVSFLPDAMKAAWTAEVDQIFARWSDPLSRS